MGDLRVEVTEEEIAEAICCQGPCRREELKLGWCMRGDCEGEARAVMRLLGRCRGVAGADSVEAVCASHARLLEALRKISDLAGRDGLEPLDEAIGIARTAIG